MTGWKEVGGRPRTADDWRGAGENNTESKQAELAGGAGKQVGGDRVVSSRGTDAARGREAGVA